MKKSVKIKGVKRKVTLQMIFKMKKTLNFKDSHLNQSQIRTQRLGKESIAIQNQKDKSTKSKYQPIQLYKNSKRLNRSFQNTATPNSILSLKE